MVNNTLNGALMELGETMAGNLEAMGVTDASPDDGLTTLAGRILDVEPSIKGLNLDTSLVITTTQEIIGLGESIILTSTLRASYDDTTVVDVDLSGVLTGATVKFYNGTTLLGTAITDLNGIATYTYTPSQLGNFTFHTVFEGTENFTNCNSNNVNITVINPPTSLVLQADKSILSYYDNDNCTLTATLLDSNGNGVSGEEIVFKANGGVLGTVITGDNGVAQYTYQSTGVGDVTITAECMNLQEIFVVEDCSYYNTNEVSRTTTNGSTIYDNNLSMSLSPNCEISYEIWSDNANISGEHRYFILPLSQYNSGTTQPQYALYFDQVGGNNGNFGKRENNSTVSLLKNFSCTGSTYHTIKYVKNGISVKMYVDDELKVTTSISWIDNYSDYSLSMMRWSSNGTSKIRNVKFKPL